MRDSHLGFAPRARQRRGALPHAQNGVVYCMGGTVPRERAPALASRHRMRLSASPGVIRPLSAKAARSAPSAQPAGTFECVAHRLSARTSALRHACPLSPNPAPPPLSPQSQRKAAFQCISSQRAHAASRTARASASVTPWHACAAMTPLERAQVPQARGDRGMAHAQPGARVARLGPGRPGAGGVHLAGGGPCSHGGAVHVHPDRARPRARAGRLAPRRRGVRLARVRPCPQRNARQHARRPLRQPQTLVHPVRAPTHNRSVTGLRESLGSCLPPSDTCSRTLASPSACDDFIPRASSHPRPAPPQIRARVTAGAHGGRGGGPRGHGRRARGHCQHAALCGAHAAQGPARRRVLQRPHLGAPADGAPVRAAAEPRRRRQLHCVHGGRRARGALARRGRALPRRRHARPHARAVQR